MSRKIGKSILGRVCRASIVASGSAALLIACGGGGDSTGSPPGAPRAAPADAATVAPGGGTPTAGIDPALIPSEDLPEAQTDGPPASADRGDSDGTTPEQPAQAVSENGTKGQWSAVSSWPIIAIHAVLTPNGKVMTYGTDQAGAQGAQLVYDVWDPATQSHSLLPNATGTDIFCNAQLVLPDSGKVLLAGGDIRGQGLPNGFGGILVNRGVRDVNLFDARDLTLSASGTPMTYARWYASLTTLSDGRVLTLGGTDGSGGAVLTPEIFNGIGAGWTPLSGAQYAGYKFYPRSFLAPNGKVVIASDKRLFSLDPNGVGSIQAVGTLPNEIRWDLPTAMFARGKVLTQNLDGTASVIDMNGLTPSVRNVESGGTNRHWATMTVLPDGQVLNTGGARLQSTPVGILR